MATTKDSRLTWGVSLLVFGSLFLIRQLRIIPVEVAEVIFDFKNYPFILGVIFFALHKNKNIGLVLIVVGLLFRISDIIRWTQHISDFIWPFLLIVAGVLVIYSGRKGK